MKTTGPDGKSEGRNPKAEEVRRNRCPAVAGAALALLLPWASAQAATTAVRLTSVTEVAGREVTVPVQLVAQGTENALSFSLAWNPTLLSYLGETVGPGAVGAALIPNTNQLVNGRIGYAMARSFGQHFPSGTNDLLRLRFQLGLTVTNTTIAFTNAPIVLETVDDLANPLSSAYSNGLVTITPLFLPGILTQPQGRTVQPITNVVTNVIVSVTATGSPPICFQWRVASHDLADATNTALTLTNVTPANSGSYDVVVRNSGGAVTSQVAVVTVLPALVPPAIGAPPQSWVASAGEDVLFSITASGTEPLSYQWRTNSSPLPGQTNRTLLLTNVIPARSGSYSCVVTNRAGSVTSASATLAVSPTPRLLRIADRSVATSTEVEVPVELVALGDENALGFSLAFDPARLNFVSAVAGGGAPDASLLVNTNELPSGRVGVALVRGTGGRFTAGASVAMQVRLRAGEVSGPVALGFTNRPVQLEVADVWGTPRPLATTNGTVTILATPPLITVSPVSVTNPIFGTALFTVSAAGSQPLSYQWQCNGTNLAGQTQPTLTLTGVLPSQAGGYRVIVTNAVALATSSVATLTVPRVLRVASTNAPTGNLVDVPLQLLAAGDENALGFSLRFDPARLSFWEVVSNSAPAGATLNVNTNGAAAGALGLVVAHNYGSSFAWGTQQVAVARFLVGRAAGGVALTFGDAPVPRELVDNSTAPLLVDFPTGAVTALLVPPVVIQPPLPQDVLQGTPVSFSVAARGSLPLTCQWQRNGSDLPGQTGTNLSLPNVLLADAGSYSARLANAAGVTNSAAATLTVRPPPADLFVTQLAAPLAVVAGEPVTVWWTVTNHGTQTAPAPWQDRVFLADDAQGSGARTLGSFTFFSALATNQWLNHTGTVIVPTDLAGTKYFGVTVDSAYQVPESNETNNTFVAALASQITAADLRVRLLSSAPTGQFGGTLSVSWAVTNVGSAPAGGSWSDRLYLSPASNSVAGATVLATAAGLTPLAAGAGYLRTLNATLPANAQWVAGTYFLVAAADYDNAQAESSEANNLAAAPIVLTQPPRPDLEVAQVVAPAAITPGQAFPLAWAVTNRGGIPATGVWSDAVWWSNAVSGWQELARFDDTNGLAAGAAGWRTQAVTVPLSGPAGTLWFAVQADVLGEIAEENENNNLSQAASATTVPAVLTLQVPLTQIAEDAPNPVFTCTVIRNGDLVAALTVSLASSDTNGVAVPASVLLPAGQSSATFQARVIRDNVVTGPRWVTLTAAAAGRPSSQQTVTVLNVDLPRLTVTFATNSVIEGDSVLATVARDLVTSEALTVVLQSSSPSRLSPPTFVTIPGGASSATFHVLAVDNNTVEAYVACQLTATATGFEGAPTTVTVLDNDLPGVVVTLASSVVSEGAGPQATVATVTRSVLSARSLAVDLESTNTAAALVPARVVIPASQLAVTFPVAAVKDDLVSGPKTTWLRPFVLATVGNTRLYEGVGVLLTVTDDDGPTLKVVAAKTLVAEGLNPATTLTLTRNTPATNDLVVTLASSDPSEATVPPNATIPASTNAVTVDFTSLADGIPDGNQPVVITASVPGFVAGVEHLTVSDSDLSDLVVSTVTAPGTADTDTYVGLGYRVVNQGLGPAGTNFLVRVYLATDPFGGGKVLVSQVPFAGTIPVGLFFEQTVQVRLPQAAGSYWAVVEVDANQQIAEVLENNNTTLSPAPIVARAAYGAWVQTELTNALAGTPVPLHGRATNSLGLGVPSQLVNLHILARGTARVISALTDGSGNFGITWQPLPGEAGFYQLFATHPGVSSVPVQDEFRLVGLRATPASVALRTVEGSPSAGSAVLENLSDLALTGLAVTVLSKPAGLDVGASVAGGGTLAGGATTTLSYTVLPTTAQAYGNVTLRVTSAQGASVDVTLAVSVEPLRPRLVATPASLVAGMARGRQTVVEFQLANNGGLPTGPIVLALPAVPWLTLATTNPLPPLPPGDTNAVTVTLLLTPAADLTLGAYEGSLALNSSNASLTVPFNFRALSEARGDLRITAVDELTYYAVGAPNLAGARVTVRDAVTRTNVTTGVTDTNGQFFASQLAEGYYEVEVTADKHSTYRNTHLLLAGQTNDLSAFLSRQVVTYTWTVEPIELEDRYKITIDTTFEAVVPLPVVTIDPPVIDLAELTAAETQILVTITNHGLIAAHNTHLSFPTHPLWELSPLLTQVGTLPARSGLTIPLLIRKLAAPTGSAGGERVAKDGDLGPCYAEANVCWELVCGTNTYTYCGTISFPNARAGCGSSAPYSPGGGACCGGGSIAGAHFQPVSVGTPTPCDPCMAKAAFDCGVGFLPYVGSAYGWAQCLVALGDGLTAESLETCLGNFLPPPVGCVWGFLRCKCPGAITTVPACARDLAQGLLGALGSSAAAPRARSAKDSVDPLDYYAGLSYPAIELQQLLLGDPDGRWVTAPAQERVQAWLTAFQARVLAGSEQGGWIAPTELAELQAIPMPAEILPADILRAVERWNRTLANWRNNLYEPAATPPGGDPNFISRSDLVAAAGRAVQAQNLSVAEGFPTPQDGFRAMLAAATEPSTSAGGVCARVKLRTEQQAVLTRDAFRATLEISNQDAARLENVEVTLTVGDASGADKTDRFGLRPPALSGLSGVDGTGILPGASVGTVHWDIIPTSDAAPTTSLQYYVSGWLRYTQAGTAIAVPLSPVAITVLPTPRLYVDYFHQRDVFSDDPFTDVIEPSLPFNLAVLIQNKGYGVAKNFHITSAQPQIIENEKGLLIDFQIVATEVAGRNLVPSLTADFGDLNPGQTALGRWLMTATLQGLFIDYKASFEHLDALGGVKLSLLESVKIHELIHLVQAGGAFEDGQPDFLVNEIPDVNDRPDTLYLSDGRTNPVAVVEVAAHDGPPTPARLQVQLGAAMPGGWVYLRVPEPADGAYRLAGVRRSDGAVIGLGTNVWVTDRTFIGAGRRPLREHILHLLDDNSTGLYTLTYEALPAADALAPASQVAALPASSYRRIPVSWSGADAPGGSGIAGYDLFVSVDGGAFTRWLERTTLGSSVYFGQLGSAYAFYSVASDQAGNREPAPGAPDAATAVTLTNRPPSLTAVTNQALDEGAEFTLAVAASDPDPADVLSYSLDTAPPGLTIGPATGLIRWLTTESTGPSTNAVVVRAQDNGDPPLAATSAFTLVVREVNSAPRLAALTNRTIGEGQLLVITNVATDFDQPSNRLTFRLGAAAPAGATINPTNGIFTWRPTETQGPSTNLIAMIVTDDGLPPLGATQLVAIVVRDALPDVVLALGDTNLMVGESNSVSVSLASALELTELTVRLDLDPARLTNVNLVPVSGEVTAIQRAFDGTNQYRFTLALNPGALPPSQRELARLTFAAVPQEHSAIVPLTVGQLAATKSGAQPVARVAASDGRLFVVGREPLLVANHTGPPSLTLYGHPGAGCAIESRTNLLAGAPWAEVRRLTLDARSVVASGLPVLGAPQFFRAYEFTLAVLGIQAVGGPRLALTLAGPAGGRYEVQTATNLTAPAAWQPVLELDLTNSPARFWWTNGTEARRYFRALTH